MIYLWDLYIKPGFRFQAFRRAHALLSCLTVFAFLAEIEEEEQHSKVELDYVEWGLRIEPGFCFQALRRARCCAYVLLSCPGLSTFRQRVEFDGMSCAKALMCGSHCLNNIAVKIRPVSCPLRERNVVHVPSQVS
jgi:hypothetical protein